MTSSSSSPRPPRRILVTTLVVLGTLAGFLAIPGLWVERQFLDTDVWTETSSELLESPPIREQVAGFLVDELYANVNVEGQIASALPPALQGLAGPAASGLRNVADEGANELLQRPRVQELWKNANRAAHKLLLDLLEGGRGALSTTNGVVVLDLRQLLVAASTQLGIGGQLVSQIPQGAAEITLLESDKLEAAQTGLTVLQDIGIVLVIVALLLFAIAIAIAGRRREALRAVGIGFVVAGAGALVARELAGNALVDSLASTAAVKPAIESAFTIGTTLLVEAAQSTLAYGVVIVIAAWLAGRTRLATGTRRVLAPFLEDARIAYGGLALLFVLLVAWGPTPATRAPLPLLFFALLLAFGLELLRRQVKREFPDAPFPKPRLPGRGGGAKGNVAQLERLARLHEQGVIDDAELAREKAAILSG